MVSWMDISASKAVHRFLKDTKAELALTRAIDAIEFKEPVYVGNWVNFEAKILETGKSSIVIQINAFKESHHIEKVLACKAIFTFVSVKRDSNGKFIKVNFENLFKGWQVIYLPNVFRSIRGELRPQLPPVDFAPVRLATQSGRVAARRSRNRHVQHLQRLRPLWWRG